MGRRGTGCFSPTTLLVLATLAVLALLFTQRMGSPLDMFRRPEATTERIGPALIEQIKQVNRLETHSYVLDGVYRVGQEAGGASDFLYQDVMVLAARAEVVAGIDLSKLREEDVQVIGSTVAITLPASEILVFSMDERSTRVYDRQQGWLVGLGLVGADPALETRARQFAQEMLMEDACERGLLQDAAREGEQTMSRLLRALEFTEVRVVAPVGSCDPAALGRQFQATPAASPALSTPAVQPPATGAVPTTPPATEAPLPEPSATPQIPATPTSGGLSGTVVIVSPQP